MIIFNKPQRFIEQLIASGGHDGTVKLWKLDGTLIATLKGHDASVVSVAFNPDGQLFASNSWDKTVILGNLSQTINWHQLDKIGCNWVRRYLRKLPILKKKIVICAMLSKGRNHLPLNFKNCVFARMLSTS